jgi:putative ABC transport system permease protein
VFWDAFLLAARALRRNVMRSVLTILGVVIGVGAVIAMVTLGNGTTARVTSSIQSLGSNLLIAQPGAAAGRGPGGTAVPGPAFTIRDLTAIVQAVPGIAAEAPVASARAQTVFGNQNWPTTITGTDDGYFDVREWNVQTGREFTDAELRSGRSVCVIGTTVRDNLFQGQDPLGASIRVKDISCPVIGVLSSKGQAMGGLDQDDLVLMPLRAVQRRLKGNEDVDLLQISVQSGELIDGVDSAITALLRERRHIIHGKQDDFRVRNLAEVANTIEATTRTLTLFLGALAAVSLLVGGIGIMNIMLVSVTERTREIGIRLAIGATERDVLTQFLLEAIALSLMGGMIGVVLGVGGSYFAVPLMGVPFVFNAGIVVLAFGFSGAIGIIFGFFPAQKAARLDPIEALRHE